MEYFKGIKNLDELKEQFRNLCKIHHPDLGGDEETMKAINNEYQEFLKTQDFEAEGCKTSADIEEAIRNIIEETIVYPGLKVELCGRWVWFTGETKKYKEQLKALGCFWAKKKVAWYWRPADEKKGNRKPLSLEKIRAKYGSKEFEPEERPAVQQQA